MLIPYSHEIEEQMQEFYNRLPEKFKRLYAGIEAFKLSYGGITYIAELFKCSRNTVQLGVEELSTEETLPQNRNRKEGGGRKAILEKELDINEVFLQVLIDNTAGNPMDETQKWTNLTRANISELLAKKGFKVGLSQIFPKSQAVYSTGKTMLLKP